ncbi:glycosyltransferase [Tautonia plasticadhaerens]|uniref:Chondroitin synthase n=1 Tax=Tautonia plasticadhaerens TaxID=2527974 RepID=A0A518HFJ4_9BACT|nr:glycosyltransferase [Tautonia plasticadhaerens]QDV39613.1 Chondroitin synthase [Tautonia plasticadhaerens]
MFNPIDHPICLVPPDRICPSAWHEHFPIAGFLVDLLTPAAFVEIGTLDGFSYCAFCQAVRALGLASTGVSVGSWPGQGPPTGLREHHDLRYGRFSTLVPGGAGDALARFEEGAVDLLHLVGSPLLGDTVAVLDDWLPKMSPRGVALLHGTRSDDRPGGTRRAWTRVKDRFPAVEFPHGGGLGMLAVGGEIPDRLRPLFEDWGEEHSRLLGYFAGLGRLVSIRAAAEPRPPAAGSDRDRTGRELTRRLEDRERILARMRDRFEERQRTVLWLEAEVSRRDAKIDGLWTQAHEQAMTIADLAARLDEVERSLAWKVAQAARRVTRSVAPPGIRRQRGVLLAARAARLWKREGLLALIDRALWGRPDPIEVPRAMLPAPEPDPEPAPVPPEPQLATPEEEPPVELPEPVSPYDIWVENNAWNQCSRFEAERALAGMDRRPLMSVVMPVYDIDEAWLERAIESVRAQVYPSWELCIADDASPRPHVGRLLRRYEATDDRIRVRFLPENGNISLASNAAAGMARGEYLVFLDQDDELTPDCLLELALAAVGHDSPDLIYSDDDKIDVHGRRSSPQFKPDWSPELLLSYMYLSHAFCVRRDRFEAIGGFRIGFEGCQDYDLALRMTDGPSRVVHVPKILYHWRSLPGSTASSGAAKPEAFERGIRAVQEAFDRRGIVGRISRPEFAERGHLGLFQVDFPDDGPGVSILIPTRNRVDLLRPCIDSILALTSYRNYEVVVIDNESDDPETLAYLDALPEGCRVLRIPNEGKLFSYDKVNNKAIGVLGDDRELILLLNDDTEVLRPEWLSQLVGYSRIEGVGAVGGRLLLADGRVQHAGVLTTVNDGMPAHAFKLSPGRDNGYQSYAVVARNYGAVTAACLLMRRDLFLRVGGFDEDRFAVAYNDIDLCLRLGRLGLRIVYAPRAELVLVEGASRGSGDDPREPLAYKEIWGLARDPYHNPNLGRNHESFALRTRRSTPAEGTLREPVRLLMVSHNLNHEGAPKFLLDLAVRLRERGRVVTEVASPLDGPLAQAYEAEGIPVHRIDDPLRRLVEPDGYRIGTRELGDWIRSRGFDLVQANTLNGFAAISAAREAGLPSLWSVHESTDCRAYFRQFGPGMTEAALLAFGDPYRVLFVSHATRRMFEPLNWRHNLETVHFGMIRDPIDRYLARHSRRDAAEAIGAPPGKKVVTIIGTVCERKGQRDLVEAAVELLRSGRDDVVFYVVGCRPSPYLDGLRRLASAYPDAIRLVDETDQVFPYYRSSDVFVCCSSVESYPRTILEAMAFGLPIVTTTVFGIAEQVEPGINALTFEPRDVIALEEHLRLLLDDDALRLRLAEAARLRLELLPTFEEMACMYERIILEAVAAATPAVAPADGLRSAA